MVSGRVDGGDRVLSHVIIMCLSFFLFSQNKIVTSFMVGGDSGKVVVIHKIGVPRTHKMEN